ncbi:hypothetical protein LC612_28480 [Nostoc sp. CHAB 5834]|nr:hypothetical protein [Nostoc sp. CHAB 5834]
MTQVTNETLKALLTPFPESDISWRVGKTFSDGDKGQALPYISARAVQTRLDEVVGPGNWRNSFVEIFNNGKFAAVRCGIAIKVDGEWVEKFDTAPYDEIGALKDEVSRSMAFKGVYSDAEKRSAVQWGIGRYLYAFQAPWVALDDKQALVTVPRLPSAFLPEVEAVVRREEEERERAAVEKSNADATAEKARKSREAAEAVLKGTNASKATPSDVQAQASQDAAPSDGSEKTVNDFKEPVVEQNTKETAPEKGPVPSKSLAESSSQETPPQDTSRADRESEIVDRMLGSKPSASSAPAPSPSPSPAPAPAPAAANAQSSQSNGEFKPAGNDVLASTDEVPEGFPPGLYKSELALILDIVSRFPKNHPAQLRAYINSKGKTKLSSAAVVFLNEKLDAYVAQAQPA